jgi:hypothetical protein
MSRGTSLDDVLRDLREVEGLGTIESIRVLRTIAPITLNCAKGIVFNAEEGRSYASVTLAVLDTLADTPSVGGVDFFTSCNREAAIIDRKPYLLYARDRGSSAVRLYTSDVALEHAPGFEAPGWICGDTVTFERVCDDVRRAAAAWPSELRIVRDGLDELLLHVVRARS